MKPYRLKHVPTGLYLSKHRGGYARLNEVGRVYISGINSLNYDKRDFSFNAYVPYQERVITVYKHDFIKEEVRITPV